MSDSTSLERKRDQQFSRWFLAIAGSVYLVWWFAVELLLPGSFNPLWSRLIVVLITFAFYGLSFVNPWIERNLRILALACIWMITLHYFYLFYGNAGDINWVIGSYITVIAVTFCFLSNSALLTYSLFVAALAVWLTYLIPHLRSSVFLPGLLTILIQANLGLRSRLGLIRKVEQDAVVAMTLAENVRVRDEFISLASHELRTPISSLKLQTQMIARDLKKRNLEELTPDKLTEFVALFNRQIDRLAELVETMFDVSRISTGHLALQKETFDLASLVREVAGSATGISLETPDELEIQGDHNRLKQVFENLVNNAVKYGEGKPISVRLSERAKTAIFTIEDHGIGISRESQTRIFDRFERAVPTQNISGLGLGLYIAKQIVETHGGTISVASELKRGSTFTVTLPTTSAPS